MNSTPKARAANLAFAAEALHAARHGDDQAALGIVTKMAHQLGAQALTVALLAWIDATLTTQGLGAGIAGTRPPKLIPGADDDLAVTGWVAGMFQARVDNDEVAFNALIRGIPRVPEAHLVHVMAALMTCGRTINRVEPIGPPVDPRLN